MPAPAVLSPMQLADFERDGAVLVDLGLSDGQLERYERMWGRGPAPFGCECPRGRAHNQCAAARTGRLFVTSWLVILTPVFRAAVADGGTTGIVCDPPYHGAEYQACPSEHIDPDYIGLLAEPVFERIAQQVLRATGRGVFLVATSRMHRPPDAERKPEVGLPSRWLPYSLLAWPLGTTTLAPRARLHDIVTCHAAVRPSAGPWLHDPGAIPGPAHRVGGRVPHRPPMRPRGGLRRLPAPGRPQHLDVAERCAGGACGDADCARCEDADKPACAHAHCDHGAGGVLS
eukprot:SAG22_NODE_363_length_11694_cov_40.815783_7_plen_287_part_00